MRLKSSDLASGDRWPGPETPAQGAFYGEKQGHQLGCWREGLSQELWEGPQDTVH